LETAAVDLELRAFAREDFAEFASWFADPELNRRLGPMDDAWLDLTLSGGEQPGDETWALFRGGQLVAVVEALIDPQGGSHTIGGVATKPSLRRQGIGTAALQRILAEHDRRGIVEHTARVAADNQPGRRCAAKAGFVPLDSQPDAHGYLDLRRGR
jgi:RimJ/RimL family protein N-acetyltransferase